ncbi:helix-loop-helix DNA-binding domain-containing protein [Ditylenchus destructor]|nr:helix-loop-helix DNA-binding domain-containing protein [Ditylenchus destructor]
MVSHGRSSNGESSNRSRSTNACPVKDLSEEDLRIKRTLANRRERQRTEQLNDAFKRLRTVIPSMPSDKMSKIHTLQIASKYIQYLINEISNEDIGLTTLPLSSELSINLMRCSFNQWRLHQQNSSNDSSSEDTCEIEEAQNTSANFFTKMANLRCGQNILVEAQNDMNNNNGFLMESDGGPKLFQEQLMVLAGCNLSQSTSAICKLRNRI